jgi:predicted NBD/HSP70 family sugar kinase
MTQLIGIDIGGTNLRLGIVASELRADIKPVLLKEIRLHADFS